jgi:hypothetical protein
LYLSKNIIEFHGIPWRQNIGENNKEGKGAIFAFIQDI